MPKNFKPIKFPKDELAHRDSVEWWYFNGHLRDKYGNRYAFMDCLFKVNLRKMKAPLFKYIPYVNDIYFNHHILTDIKKQKSYRVVKPICIVSGDSFKNLPLYVSYTSPLPFRGYVNSEIAEIKPSQYHFKNENIDLYLKSKKPPLIETDTVIKASKRANYYYSLTNLETEGAITIAGKKIKVKGKSWFDHQWARASFSKIEWTWFSLQLKNNTEIVCFQSASWRSKGKKQVKFAGIIPANGKSMHTAKVQFLDQKDYWASPKSKAVYPLSWQIKIPEWGVDLLVKPLARDQELLFGFINYWEGPLAVSGIFRGKKVSGQGFLELVGYPIKASQLKIIEEEIKEMIKEELGK